MPKVSSTPTFTTSTKSAPAATEDTQLSYWGRSAYVVPAVSQLSAFTTNTTDAASLMYCCPASDSFTSALSRIPSLVGYEYDSPSLWAMTVGPSPMGYDSLFLIAHSPSQPERRETKKRLTCGWNTFYWRYVVNSTATRARSTQGS